jgi:hypothetical protein
VFSLVLNVETMKMTMLSKASITKESAREHLLLLLREANLML